MKRVIATAVAVAALASLSGCGVFKGSNKPKTPVLGNRIPVLVSEASVDVDPSIADVEVQLPPPMENAEWAQPGGNAAKAMGHLALAASPQRAWSVKIDAGSNRARLASAPVISGGRVYIVDTRARLRAFDSRTGNLAWQADVGAAQDVEGGPSFWSGEMKGTSGVVFGGGVSVDGEHLYATNGLGDVVAFNAADGKVLWKKRPGSPLRGAPTIALGNVYVMSQDNQLYALRASDGNLEWTTSGTIETAGIFGVAAPAVAQGTVVAGFSSGELNAYRYENGRPVWQDALSKTSISTQVGIINDVDADPVIDQGRVFAIGQGGRMVSLELVTGQRLWEINVAGLSTPWIAGEWLYVVADDGRVLCVARATGKVRWVTQLPRWEKEKKKKGQIAWSGPVLAGGQLVLVSTRGQIAYVSATTGKVTATVKYKTPIFLPPVVAGSTLYTVDEKGRLTAWR